MWWRRTPDFGRMWRGSSSDFRLFLTIQIQYKYKYRWQSRGIKPSWIENSRRNGTFLYYMTAKRWQSESGYYETGNYQNIFFGSSFCSVNRKVQVRCKLISIYQDRMQTFKITENLALTFKRVICELSAVIAYYVP